jgi:hypothetical protein
MGHRLYSASGLYGPGPQLAGLSFSTTPGAPTTVLAGVMVPTIPLFDSVWFQALVVFVALNTLFYAMLAVRNLIPKRPMPPRERPLQGVG